MEPQYLTWGASPPPTPPSLRTCVCRCFTLNNWTDAEVEAVKDKIRTLCAKGVFQKEVGDQGTPHLQGFFVFKKKSRPIGAFGIPRIHFEKCRGNEVQNITYCTKSEGRAEGTTPWFFNCRAARALQKVTYERLRSWQKGIADKYQDYAEEFSRSVDWYWEPDGAKGKTVLAKYFVDEKGAICIGGKGHDIRFAIAEYVKANGQGPDIVVINLVREQAQHCSYTAIEQIKDGLFFSGKYEGGMVRFNTPHVIVFANFEPDREKLSEDRWNITRLRIL